MYWPPRIGDPLPRAGDAWYEQHKLEWILGTRGHGGEWERVFRISLGDQRLFWEAITKAALDSTIDGVRDRSPYGVACEVKPRMALNGRVSLVVLSWHYPFESAAPRLVTAYPTT